MNKEELVSYVRGHRTAWYRDRWGGETAWEKLPCVARRDFLATPLSHRRYEEGKSLVKLVHTDSGVFAAEHLVADIAREPFGEKAKRPFVYFSNPHETVEKGLWCYENGMTRLIGEKTPEIAEMMARKFEIDAVITDTATLRSLLPFLSSLKRQLTFISVIDSRFDPMLFVETEKVVASVRLVLALPETGAIAHSDPRAYPHFVPTNAHVEGSDGTLVVTKLQRLMTPIIKFDTEIRGSVSAGQVILA
jgi:hypothetical protein